MTAEPYPDLHGNATAAVLWAVLRGLLYTTFLVVLYYLLPLDEPLGASAGVRILIGLLIFAGIGVWQVRNIAALPILP